MNKPITTNIEILQNIENLYLADKNKDKDCISLYDALKLIRQKRKKYEEMKKQYEEKASERMEFRNEETLILHITNVPYDKDLLRIFIWTNSESNDFFFAKDNTTNDVYLKYPKETLLGKIYAGKLLAKLGTMLIEMYDEFMKYADIFDESYQIKSINAIDTDFKVVINFDRVEIYFKNPDNELEKDFSLTMYSNDEERQYMECNSAIVNGIVHGKEYELLKRIYVKIEDCPEWTQDELYTIREKQLETPEVKIEQTKNKFKKRILGLLNRKCQ